MAKRADFSGLVTNPKMKLVLRDCNHMCGTRPSVNYNNRSTWRCVRGCGETDMPQCEKSKCTNGPTTWYLHAGIQLWWWASPSGATVDEMKRRLGGCGMVAVWHGTGQTANSTLNSSQYLRPGDVASMISSDSAHGVMWTGEDWRSDFWQGGKPYPYSAVGRGGDWTFILWRHPALQEPGTDIMGGGFGNVPGQGAGTGGSHEWPDFNLKDFPILEDEKGRYTEEPIGWGIANHLRYSTGGNGAINGSVSGGQGITGNTPFSSPEDFLSKINWSACERYAAGGYRGYQSMVTNRKIDPSRVPSDFLAAVRNVSAQTGVPVAFYVGIAKSESGYKNSNENSSGYGGYFGSKLRGSIEEQAASPTKSYNNAKNASPGADSLALLALGYIHHHLPAVGSKYWSITNGNIWSTDPDYIVEKITACWPPLASKAVTRAEALAVNLAAQYMALQLRTMSF